MAFDPWPPKKVDQSAASLVEPQPLENKQTGWRAALYGGHSGKMEVRRTDRESVIIAISAVYILKQTQILKMQTIISRMYTCECVFVYK